MNNIEQIKRHAEDYLAAMGNGDTARMMELVADDLEYWIAGRLSFSGNYSKAGLQEIMGGIGQFFPSGLRVTPTSIIGEGNRVAIEGAGGGLTVTGKTYDNHYHFLFEFDGAGKISKRREYMDTCHAVEIFAAR